MTVEIIVPGCLPEKQIFRAMCGHCKCQFSFAREDATPGLDRNEECLKIKCPTKDCQKVIFRDVREMRIV